MPRVNLVSFTLNEMAIRKIIISTLLQEGSDGHLRTMNVGEVIHVVRAAKLPGIYCSEDKVLKVLWKTIAVEMAGVLEPERLGEGVDADTRPYIAFYQGPASTSELRFRLVKRDERNA